MSMLNQIALLLLRLLMKLTMMALKMSLRKGMVMVTLTDADGGG